MKPERFEELVEIGTSKVYKPGHWRVDREDFEKFLTAVYPSIRDEAIEDCVRETHLILRDMISPSDAAATIRALKSKDTKL